MSNLPTGTVTFLFTDIEGSTRLAQQYPDAVARLLERHHAILKSAIEAHGGYVFEIIGDAFCAAFPTVREALHAAVEAQTNLGAESWSPEAIRVRMGISTGTVQLKLREGHPPAYSGYMSLAHAQRVMSVAYGGQILLADASAGLVRGELPQSVALRDMGEHRLKSLLNPERLWQVSAPGLQADFPPLKSLNAIPNNLPLQLTSFIGREREMAEVAQLLDAHRLVTLTGSGGTGKSRLALQVAADMLDQFHDGVWFAELAPISEPALIPQTVIRILGLSGDSVRGPLDVLKDYLDDKTLLLVLDNCEHLLDAACRFADAILQAAPHVKIMPTSREALNLVGEQAYRVPSLSAPDVIHLASIDQLTQFEAVRLFIERATLVSPRFALSDANAPAIAQICHRLDGIPLAIELAAARVKSMPLDAIVSRLDDRFRLLTGGSRMALPRQQTLRAMIDWSYNLLSEQERLVLQRLSVFRGGWTLEAAEAVFAGEGIEQRDVDDLLSKLVDKSLVSLDEHDRYRMLETVRQYASEKLIDSGEAEAVRDEHLKYMLALAEQAEPEIVGANQLVWLDLLDRELDNLRAAIQWAQQHNSESFLRLSSALWFFCDLRAVNHEAAEWLILALRQTTDQHTRTRALGLARAAYLLGAAGKIYGNVTQAPLVMQFAREAKALGEELNDPSSLAMALLALGLSTPAGDSATAVASFRQALAVAKGCDDHALAATILGHLGFEAGDRNDFMAAQQFLEQGIREARLSTQKRVMVSSLRYFAAVLIPQNEMLRAKQFLEEAQQIAREIGDKPNTFYCCNELAKIALATEDYAKARQLMEEQYLLAKALHSRRELAKALFDFGTLERAEGNLDAFCECAGQGLIHAQQANDEGSLAAALLRAGECAHIAGNFETAGLHYAKVLTTLGPKRISKEATCYVLQDFAALALAQGWMERGIRLFAARTRLREITYAEDFYPFMVRQREKQIAEARAALGDEAFDKAWAEGQAMGEDEMVAYALEERASPKN